MTLALPLFLIAALLLLPSAEGAVIGFAEARGVIRNPAPASADDKSA